MLILDDWLYVCSWMLSWWVWEWVHIHESVYEYVHLDLAHISQIVEGWKIGVEIYIKAFEMVLEMFQ